MEHLKSCQDKGLNMDIDYRDKVYIGLLAVLTVALVGVSGGLYFTFEQIQDLEESVNDLEGQKQVIYTNNTDRGYEAIYDRVSDSVVYIQNTDSQGSGFVYSENGYIVTNHHVVENEEDIQVTFTDGETFNAEIVGGDPYTDLAVLKVDRVGLEPLKLGNTSDVNVGQTALAIGNPFGLESSITHGIISQKGRSITVEGGFSIRNVLQTDASINPGNSGGPLLNRKGEVVGVNTAIETNTGTFSGVGFAIPSSTVKRVIPEVIDEGEYEHPWIGVRGLDMTPERAEAMDLNESKGFLILEVVNGSPADEAGLQPSNDSVVIDGANLSIGGDVIVGIDDKEIRGIEDILEYLALRTDVGDTITLEVIRDGEIEEVELILGERPES
jgi:S1-C subfamily serine protease